MKTANGKKYLPHEVGMLGKSASKFENLLRSVEVEITASLACSVGYSHSRTYLHES